MKKIKVLRGHQKGKDFFLLCCDPRKIIKLVEIPEKNSPQENQRPWKETKVKDIAKYVAGVMKISDDDKDVYAKGIIPNCPILNIYPPMRIVKEGEDAYILLPDTEVEFAEYKGRMQILDGQHRLIAFSDDHRHINFKDQEKYYMGFVIFENLTLQEKRELFMVCNDKQEKVEANLLKQFKKWLGLLSEDEENLSRLVENLNTEQISPLKGRIIIGGNKVPNGLKSIQVAKILKKSDSFELIKSQDLNTQTIILSYYLTAWNAVYNTDLGITNIFSNPKNTLAKISGLRYIFYLFPYVYEVLKETRRKLNQDCIEEVLRVLHDQLNGYKIFEDDTEKLLFRAETATIAFARKHGQELKNHVLNKESVFDPADIN